MINKKIVILVCCIALGIIILSLIPDRTLRITMCDVGQGDAIVIKTPKNNYHLIDGGPDNSVLSCIARNTKWYNRSISSITVSHLHADHVTGVIEVIKRYQTKTIFINKIKQDSPETQELYSQIKLNKLVSKETKASQIILYEENITGTVYWPEHSSWNRESGEWKAYLDDFNDSSQVSSLNYRDIMVLFTGDAGTQVLDKVAEKDEFKADVRASQIRILKFPHHGSADGISKKLLDEFKPHVALISAGKDNSFGHPHKASLDMLAQSKVKVMRTDESGDISIISDGKKVWTRKSKE